MAELGICFRCGKCKDDCSTSNVGSVCHDCWQAMAKAPPIGPDSERVSILPKDPMMKGFVVMEGGIYITVDTVLYFFLRREDAEFHIKEIRKCDPLPEGQVVEIPFLLPFLYVHPRNGLKLLVVEERRVQ